MAKHEKPTPQLIWHGRGYGHRIPNTGALHAALFTDYPKRTIDRALFQGLTPHIKTIKGCEPLRYMFWTTRDR